MKTYYVKAYEDNFSYDALRKMVTNDPCFDGVFDELNSMYDREEDTFYDADDAIDYLIEKGEVADVTKGRFKFSYSGIHFATIDQLKDALLLDEMQSMGCDTVEELLQCYKDDGTVVDLYAKPLF